MKNFKADDDDDDDDDGMVWRLLQDRISTMGVDVFPCFYDVEKWCCREQLRHLRQQVFCNKSD